MPHSYEFPRAALTVDCAVFGFEDARLCVLLVRRGIEPFAGRWALPGGFLQPGERAEAAARRELAEETGLDGVWLEPLGVFDAPDRDPRERVISIAYCALVRRGAFEPRGGTDAAEAAWHPADGLPALAFDHAAIVSAALGYLRGQLRHRPIGFEMLPKRFTLSEIQALYEAVLGRALDKRNFRRKLLQTGLVKPCTGLKTDGPHRPAQWYEFDRARHRNLLREGFHFEF